ncbi:MAG: hypothetical protein OXF65_06410 [Acidimicrobiaceae bacterium]|nr:hypothetical protein [Acidimicrobiaceae bacterium]
MSDDIDTGSIAPPQRQVESAVDVRGLDQYGLEAHVTGLLASVGEVASGPEGSVASLSAVWVISQVEESCGMGKLVGPQDLTKDDLANPTTLSRMLHCQIRKQDAPVIGS